MGSANTRPWIEQRKAPLKKLQLSRDESAIVVNSKVAKNGSLVGSSFEERLVEITNDEIRIHAGKKVHKRSPRHIVKIGLDKNIEFSLEPSTDKDDPFCDLLLRFADITVCLRFPDVSAAKQWKIQVEEEVRKAQIMTRAESGRSLQKVLEIMERDFGAHIEEEMEEMTVGESVRTMDSAAPFEEPSVEFVHHGMVEGLPPPPMKIVVLVVGTRGDVQPFVNLGLSLREKGHDVRIATHVDYRNDVQKEGLKYYPLAGDPRKLSEYMVKTGGRLIPDLLNEEERQELPEKMGMIRDILFSCWPACTAPDPEDELQTPFVADAIISNPVSYGHIHCAEALAVPLHIMFPQPWSPTKSFPHPLSNVGFTSKWSLRNKMTFKMVDEFMWMGFGSMVNVFRKDVLKLAPIRSGEGGDSLLVDNKVPISHMWSPSFVPKCIDWGKHVDVVGDFVKVPPPDPDAVRSYDDQAATTSPASTPVAGAAAAAAPLPKTPDYVPDERLADFLVECGEEHRPIYIGFGSMVMSDSTKLVRMVKSAADATGHAVLMQSGWTKYAEDYSMLGERIMVVGAMPHSWLFEQVSAVIHHGGAGTTSAGLRAGKPTFICPFFGDQHFWAEMVNRAGAGPPGCPIENLTETKLSEAFTFLRSPETISRVEELGAKMRAENGVENGIRSFYRNLPLEDMLCEVSLFQQKSRIARFYCDDCGLKLSAEVDTAVHRAGSGRETHVRIPYKCVKWGVAPPSSLLSGLGQGMGGAAYEIAGGLYDLVSAPIIGAQKEGAIGAAKGMARGVTMLIARPVKGGGILIDKIRTGLTTQSHHHLNPKHHGSLHAHNSTGSMNISSGGGGSINNNNNNSSNINGSSSTNSLRRGTLLTLTGWSNKTTASSTGGGTGRARFNIWSTPSSVSVVSRSDSRDSSSEDEGEERSSVGGGGASGSRKKRNESVGTFLSLNGTNNPSASSVSRKAGSKREAGDCRGGENGEKDEKDGKDEKVEKDGKDRKGDKYGGEGEGGTLHLSSAVSHSAKDPLMSAPLATPAAAPTAAGVVASASAEEKQTNSSGAAAAAAVVSEEEGAKIEKEREEEEGGDDVMEGEDMEGIAPLPGTVSKEERNAVLQRALSHTIPFVEDDDHPLTEEEIMDKALERAKDFRKLFMMLDKSGDRFISIRELEEVLPHAEAEALLKCADINEDGELTFAELASQIVVFSKANKLSLSSKND